MTRRSKQDWLMEGAKALAEHTYENFFDAQDGFFHYAGKDAEKLIAARKEILDNVIPASNSVMAQNMYHLGIIFDNPEWKKLAENMVFSLSHLIVSEPNYMSNWGIAYTEMKKGLAEVVFAGEEAQTKGLEIFRGFRPFMLAMGSQGQSSLPLLEGKTPVNDQFTIYVCHDKTCQRPVHEIDEAIAQL